MGCHAVAGQAVEVEMGNTSIASSAFQVMTVFLVVPSLNAAPLLYEALAIALNKGFRITRGDNACSDERARVNPTLKLARLATDDSNSILRRLNELVCCGRVQRTRSRPKFGWRKTGQNLVSLLRPGDDDVVIMDDR
eukprot:scaffold86495_cov59-Attheya_sp.AAC.4